MPVDVLHRYRRQISALPHSRAEMGHHQRVSTELIEEVAIDRHAVDAQDVSEHLGEDAFGAGGCGAAPILDQRRFSHCPTHARSWNSTAASRIGRRSGRRGALPTGDLRSEPCATCSSHGLVYTHLPTARSSSPMSQGEEMIGRLRFTDRPPIMKVGKGARHRASISVLCSARWLGPVRRPCQPETHVRRGVTSSPRVSRASSTWTSLQLLHVTCCAAPQRYLAGRSDSPKPLKSAPAGSA